METVRTIIRLALTIILLYFVWSNAHWSVATCLTLIFVRAEIALLELIIRKNET